MATLATFDDDTIHPTDTFNNNEEVEGSLVRRAGHVPPGSPRTATNSALLTQSIPMSPPLREPTASVGSLPPVFSLAAVNGTVSEGSSTDLDNSNNQHDAAAAATATTGSQRGNGALAVAEIVPSTPNSLDDFGNELDDHIEDRAIEIARRAWNEMRRSSVQEDPAVFVADAQEPQPPLEPEAPLPKDMRTAEAERRRIYRLLALATTMVVVATALVIALVILSTENDRKSTDGVQSERCSLCAGGVESSKSPDELRSTTVYGTFTCADLKLYQQQLSSSDTNCPLHQSMAFIRGCGCPAVPVKPPNATCKPCPDGAVATGPSQCNQLDAAVTIIGSALFYLDIHSCGDYNQSWFGKWNCTCTANTSMSRV